MMRTFVDTWGGDEELNQDLKRRRDLANEKSDLNVKNEEIDDEEDEREDDEQEYWEIGEDWDEYKWEDS